MLETFIRPLICQGLTLPCSQEQWNSLVLGILLSIEPNSCTWPSGLLGHTRPTSSFAGSQKEHIVLHRDWKSKALLVLSRWMPGKPSFLRSGRSRGQVYPPLMPEDEALVSERQGGDPKRMRRCAPYVTCLYCGSYPWPVGSCQARNGPTVHKDVRFQKIPVCWFMTGFASLFETGLSRCEQHRALSQLCRWELPQCFPECAA